MAEEKWQLDTPDGFTVYGLVNSVSRQKRNTKAILHVHGLRGSQNDYAAIRLAHTMPRYGYDVIRINLYSAQPKARSLPDCTVAVHAEDINLIAKHFLKHYDTLYATGHSYGGPSIMSADTTLFTAITLWDPTFLPSALFHTKDFTRFGKDFISQAGIPYVVSEAFMKEAQSFDRQHAIHLAQKCKTPLQVIYAAFWSTYGESFHTHAQGPVNEKKILSSAHSFVEENTTAPLLRYTREWFNSFS